MWIKTDFDFCYPFAVLTADLHDAPACELRDIAAENQEDVAALETRLLSFVRFYRPELVGGFIIHLTLNLTAGQWEIGYFHPSFERVPRQNTPPRQPLVQVHGGQMKIEDDPVAAFFTGKAQ